MFKLGEPSIFSDLKQKRVNRCILDVKKLPNVEKLTIPTQIYLLENQYLEIKIKEN
jgi:hypothetical protein